MDCESIDVELSNSTVRYKPDNEIPAVKEARIEAAVDKLRTHLDFDLDAAFRTVKELILLDHPNAIINEEKIREGLVEDAENKLQALIRSKVDSYGQVKESRIQKSFWGTTFHPGDLIMYEDEMTEEIKEPIRGKISGKYSVLLDTYKSFIIKIPIKELSVKSITLHGRINTFEYADKRHLLLQMRKGGFKDIQQWIMQKAFRSAFNSYTTRVIIRFPKPRQWQSFFEDNVESIVLKDLKKDLEKYGVTPHSISQSFYF